MDGDREFTVVGTSGEDSSSGDEQSPSNPLQELQDQVEQLANEKADAKHSKLDQKISRLEAVAEDAAERATQAEADLDEILDEIDKSELEGADDDDKPKIKASQLARRNDAQLEVERANLEADKAKHAERLAKADEMELKEIADKVAKEFGCDVEFLAKYGDSEETMRMIAEDLPKGKATTKASIPDSGVTVGATTHPTSKQLDEMPMDEYERYWHKRNKVPE